jgi:hypothetical protein
MLRKMHLNLLRTLKIWISQQVSLHNVFLVIIPLM